MKSLTWKELRDQIAELSEAELNDTATVYLSELSEAYEIEKTERVDEGHDLDGVLDLGHFVMRVY